MGTFTHTQLANLGQVGSVYGLAYNSGTNPAAPTGAPRQRRLFAGAFDKMQTRFGSGGPGAIYVINQSTGVVSLFVQVPDVVPGPNGFPGDPGDGTQATFPNVASEPTYTHESGGVHRDTSDSIARDLVGKVGLGDIDMSPDERYLYALNLNTKRIYRFDTWDANPQSTMFLVPDWVAPLNPCSTVGGAGLARPFGLKVTNTDIFLGVVCSAEATQNRADLRAGVAQYDRTTGSWSWAFNFSLDSFDAQREPVAAVETRWYAWRDGITGFDSGVHQTYPQPLITDIEIGEGGSMFVGMRDRFGDMTSDEPYTPSTRSEGDLLRATPNGSGGWNVPPSGGSEYFTDQSGGGSGQEPEAASGGLTYVPGNHSGAVGGEIVSTYLDPYRSRSFGIGWWDTATGGTPTAREEIYQGSLSTGTHQFGKAAGVGDLELLCVWRAIGDRVWMDSNGNGIQDAGEPNINGVRLQIFAASDTSFTTPLAIITTGTNLAMTGNYRFYVSPFQSYLVRVDPAMFGPGQPLFNLGYTTPDAGADDADSDADSSGAITIPAGYASEVNMTFDVGLATGANVRIAKSGPSSAVVGSALAYTLTYTNDGPSPAANVIVQDTLPAGVTFVSASPAPSSIAGNVITWNLGTLGSGAGGSITVNTTVSIGALSSVTNQAQISTTTPGDDPGDNTSTTTTTILSPNVTIQKTGPATAVTGSTISYNLSYRNTGTAAAANVTVVDTLPTSLSYVSASPAPASVSGQTITWNLGSLAAGASGTITLNATVGTSAPSSVTNQVQISTTTPGDDPGDNTSTTTTTILRPNVFISKSGPAVATVGDQFAYTLAYGNNGTAGATGVQLVDTLPAGLVFVSASPSPSTVAGQVLTWNLGTLAAGGSGSITVNVRSATSVANGTVVVNNTSISTTTPGDTPGDNSDSTSTTLQRADVYVTKSSSTSFPVVSGQAVTYFLDYGNSGPAAAVNVSLTDQVPSQLTGVTWTCVSGCAASGSGNSISVNLGTLAAGATGRIRVTGTAVTTIAREDFTNTAVISTSTPETRTDNNTSSVPGAVWTADLQIIKLAQPQVVAGNTFTATLSYRNNGPAPTANATLVDTLPAGITFVSASPAPSSVAGNVITWSLGTLADGASGTIQLVLQSDPAIANNTSLTNRAAISTSTTDRDANNNQSQADTLIITRADLSVVKTGPARVSAGDIVAYTISYSNAGPSVARGVVISDTLPSVLDYVSASPAPTSNANGVLTWNIGDVGPGQSGTITVQMQSRYDQALPALDATNQAQISSSTSDPDPDNNRDDHTTAVETVDLSIVKDMPAFAVAGVPFTATLTYANAGPADALSVTLRDLLPPGLTLIQAIPAPTGPGLRWNLGGVTAGTTGTIQLVLRAAPNTPTGTRYTNTALIDTTSSDRDPSNNTSSDTTEVRLNAELVVIKDGTPGPVRSESAITYTITYRNDGPSLARSVLLTDTLPAGFTFVSATPAPAQNSGGVLVWNLGDLAPGASGAIQLAGTITGNAPTSRRVNVAAIDSPTDDPNGDNNRDDHPIDVLRPDLSISKTDGVTDAEPGDELIYTLTIRNTGPISATGVILSETPPAPITDPAWTAQAGGSYTLPIGTVAAGATITRSVTIWLPNPLTTALLTRIVNTASVREACCDDPTPTNNTSTDIDTPIAGQVGDTIWLDKNGDGLQGEGEPGLANVPVELLDPSSGQVLATTTTDAQGHYHFSGLHLGQYAVRISPQAMEGVYHDYAITTVPIPVGTLTSTALRDDTLDIGLQQTSPTAVVLAYFLVEPLPRGTLIRWGTLAEQDTSVFRVERSTRKDRSDAVLVGITPSQGSQGGDYRVLDASAPASGTVYYWLIEVETDGDQTVYGPAFPRTQASDFMAYLPFVRR